MIRITIESIPFNKEEYKIHIGKIMIWNIDNKNSNNIENTYQYNIDWKDESSNFHEISGKIKHRKSNTVFDLLYKVLKNYIIFMKKNRNVSNE